MQWWKWKILKAQNRFVLIGLKSLKWKKTKTQTVMWFLLAKQYHKDKGRLQTTAKMTEKYQLRVGFIL